MDFLIQQYENEYKEENDGEDPPRMKDNVKAKFREQAREAKESLSALGVTDTDIFIDSFGTTFESNLTREEFEDICSDIWTRMLEPIQAAFEEANLTKEDIENVVVVGGSTRIPKVRSILKEYFGKEKVHIHQQPEQAVA